MKKKVNKNTVAYHKQQIKKIRLTNRNKNMEGMAKAFRQDLLRNITKAEKIFYEISKSKGLTLECQYIIYVRHRGSIQRFYISDFCDTSKKIIFEVDGEYHNTTAQQEKDYNRFLDLKKLGYKVYRISNEEVFKGDTTKLLYKVYPHLNKHNP